MREAAVASTALTPIGGAYRGDSLGVILGGGGVVGLAWEIGLLTGLDDVAVDLRTASRIIGTSAGAFAAVSWLSHPSLESAFARQIDESSREISAKVDPQLRRSIEAIFEQAQGDAEVAGRLLGDLAKASSTVTQDERFAVVRDRLGTDRWPVGQLGITAIDADTGKRHILDSHSGIGLVEATAASGAVAGIWPMVTAGGRNWIDGGMVSTANAELAADFANAVVIAPSPKNASGSTVWDEISRLSKNNRCLVVTPDDSSTTAMGSNPLDPTCRAATAQAAREQGRLLGTSILEQWLAERQRDR